MQQLNEYFRDYIKECEFVRRLRPATIRGSKEAFNHFIKLMPEISSLSDITPAVITAFFQRLQTRERKLGRNKIIHGIKNSTLLTYAGRLKTFFKWLKVRMYIDSNPFEFLSLPRVEYVDHRALSGTEIKKIMGAVVQGAGNVFILKRDLAMIGILTFCGLRRNELIALEVRDINLLEGYITIRPETSKSKILRDIPINVHLKMFLVEYMEQRKRRGYKCPFLFVSSTGDRRLSNGGIRHWIARVVERSGVKFHLHRFRHTFATNLAMQDVGAVKIQKLMGHTDIKMTQTYLRSISTADMREDVNKLSFENLA